MTKPRIAVYKHNWKYTQRGLLRGRDCSSIKRDHRLKHFTCGEHQKGGDQDVSGEDFTVKTYESLVAPQRIVFKPNLHHGRQDTGKQTENCGGGTCNESCRAEIDCRIQGLPHSIVQEQDHIRKKAVQKLIHQSETHPN